MDQPIFDEISNQTNIYGHEKSGLALNTSACETEQFIGLHMIMSVFKMPSYRMFWSNATRYPTVADCMSRKRFDTLRTYVHMNDNVNLKEKGQPGYDPCFKFRPVYYDKVRGNCLKVENEEVHSIDEQIIPFKGRLAMKQYIKNKPHKWGIKVFARAGVSELVYDFEVYTGKGTVANDNGIGVGGEVVLRLVRSIANDINAKCFFDNWFTSLELLVKLKDVGIWSTGTIR